MPNFDFAQFLLLHHEDKETLAQKLSYYDVVYFAVFLHIFGSKHDFLIKNLLSPAWLIWRQTGQMYAKANNYIWHPFYIILGIKWVSSQYFHNEVLGSLLKNEIDSSTHGD